MGRSERGQGSIPRDQAIGLSVGEVMISRPKTLPVTAVVGDARRLFERPSVRTVLLVEDEVFRGAVERGALPAAADDGEPVLDYAESEPLTATPEMPMRDAVALLEQRREPRLVVLDPDGVTLRGLLCVNSSATGFCVQ